MFSSFDHQGCYSALSRTNAVTAERPEGRNKTNIIAGLDELLASLGAGPLLVGSDQLCDTYNLLRSKLATWWELKMEAEETQAELQSLVDQFERVKPNENVGVPGNLLEPISSTFNLDVGPEGWGALGEDVRRQRSISEMLLFEGSPVAPTRKRKAALEQSNILKKLKARV